MLADQKNSALVCTCVCAIFLLGTIYSFESGESAQILAEETLIEPPTFSAEPEEQSSKSAEIQMEEEKTVFSEEEIENIQRNARFKDALKLLVGALKDAATEMTLPDFIDSEDSIDQDDALSERPAQAIREVESYDQPLISNFDYLRENAEFNWDWLRVSRNHTIDFYEYDRYGPNYPCLFGTSVIGSEGKHIDGNKWVCGYQYWNTDDCIVFSIGSNKLVGFEERVKAQNPNCKIFIFDPTVDSTDKWNERMEKSGFNFQYIGIGKEDGTHKFNKYPGERAVMTLTSLMRHVDADHIDVLKMDVEGQEWFFLETDEFLNALKKVRWQVLIEIHLGSHFNVPLRDRKLRMDQLFDVMESYGFRCFHKELFFQKKDRLNRKYPNNVGIEFSFVHKDWFPEGFIVADNGPDEG